MTTTPDTHNLYRQFQITGEDAELDAIGICIAALSVLDDEAAQRAAAYLHARFAQEHTP